jgi:glycosyltransferase A (GT-A) superfamily protein (DUF2064 family)
VRTHTLEKIAALGKTCAALPMLTDVDEEADWVIVQPTGTLAVKPQNEA